MAMVVNSVIRCGEFGNKVWVCIPPGHGFTFDEKCEVVSKVLSKSLLRALPVVINGRSFTGAEITYFFYNDRTPRSPTGNWQADKIVTVKLKDL